MYRSILGGGGHQAAVPGARCGDGETGELRSAVAVVDAVRPVDQVGVVRAQAVPQLKNGRKEHQKGHSTRHRDQTRQICDGFFLSTPITLTHPSFEALANMALSCRYASFTIAP